jgi:hypothetical protein
MKKILVLASVFISHFASGQNCFSLRYFGLTVHPFGDQTAALQPYKLDKNAIVVANFGVFASVDHYIKKDYLALTFMQAGFTDCSGGWGGFTHIGIRARLLDKGKHRLVFGAGPLFYYREDWNRFESYEDGGVFKRYHSARFGDVQYKIFWTGFEFAYHYELSKHFDLNVGLTPGLPLACSFSAGLTWWPKRFETKADKVKVILYKKKKK